MFRVGHNILENVLKQLEIFKQLRFLFVLLLLVNSVYNASGFARCEILHSFQLD